jgi:magnesium chelatase family protein
VARYRARVSGPLIDRIDIRIEAPAPPEQDLLDAPQGEGSAAIRARVLAARTRQLERQGGPNACLVALETERYCMPDAAGSSLVRQAITRLGLSARAYHRVLRVARSVADLAGAARVDAVHVAEAVQYRRLGTGSSARI